MVIFGQIPEVFWGGQYEPVYPEITVNVPLIRISIV